MYLIKKCTLLLSFYFLLPINLLEAQNNHNNKNLYSLKTPYETISTHILFLEKNNYNPSISAQAFLQDGVSLEEAKVFAVRLKAILRNEGIYINIDSIPQDPDFKDPAEKFNKYKLSNLLPEVYLVKVDNKWIYSKETIHNIDRLYKKVSRFKIYKISNLFPRNWNNTLAGIYFWQYAIFLIALILSRVLYMLLVMLINLFLRAILKFKGYSLALERYMSHIDSINKSFTICITILLWLTIVRPALQLPVEFSRYSVMFLKALITINFSILLYRLIDGVVFYITRGVVEERFSFHIDLLPLIRKVIKVCIFIFSFLALLKVLNFDVSGLIASLSLGSLGVALASQDTLKNLFGSVMIFIDKPFGVGDMIVTKDVRGRVEEIGMRSTILRTPEQSQVYVPNALLANSYVDNRGLNTHGDFTNKITLPADTSIEKVDIFINGFKNIISDHPQALNATSNVNLINITKGSFEIVYSLFFKKSTTYYRELTYRHEVLREVIKLANSIEVSLKLDN